VGYFRYKTYIGTSDMKKKKKILFAKSDPKVI